jgi:hypothetical protein
VPNWKGPGEIIYINDTNAKIKFKNKIKWLNQNISMKIPRMKREMPVKVLIKHKINQDDEKALKDFSGIFN